MGTNNYEEFKNASFLGLHEAMDSPPIGVQKWVAPSSGVFTLIVKGASGGHGRLSRKSSHGAVVTAIIQLSKGDILYVLVGQEGESACVHNGVETREGLCSQVGTDDDYRAKRWAEDSVHKGNKERKNTNSKSWPEEEGVNPAVAIHMINKLNTKHERMQSDEGYMSEDYLDKAQVHNYAQNSTHDQDWMAKIKDFKPSYQGGGGGGGGATFIFKVDPDEPKNLIPLIIAGGGGGMADLTSDNNPDATRILTNEDAEMVQQSSVDLGALALSLSDRLELTQAGHGGSWEENSFNQPNSSSTGQSMTGSWFGSEPCTSKGVANDEADLFRARFGGYGGGGGGGSVPGSVWRLRWRG